MVDVVYSVPTWILGVLIVGVSTTASALALAFVHRRVPTEVRRTQNDIAGYISNIAAFVYAVLLAFLAVAVWQNYQGVKSTVQLEANAASDVYRQAEGYPATFARRVREGVRAYVDVVIGEEWALQARGRESKTARRMIVDLHRDIFLFEPGNQREHIVHDLQIRVMRSLLDQRRNRVYAAASGLSPIVWTVILLGSVVIVAFCFFMGTGNIRAHFAMTAMLGASIGLVLFLIVALDRPFRGDVGIGPDAFIHVRETMGSRGAM